MSHVGRVARRSGLVWGESQSSSTRVGRPVGCRASDGRRGDRLVEMWLRWHEPEWQRHVTRRHVRIRSKILRAICVESWLHRCGVDMCLASSILIARLTRWHIGISSPSSAATSAMVVTVIVTRRRTLVIRWTRTRCTTASASAERAAASPRRFGCCHIWIEVMTIGIDHLPEGLLDGFPGDWRWRGPLCRGRALWCSAISSSRCRIRRWRCCCLSRIHPNALRGSVAIAPILT